MYSIHFSNLKKRFGDVLALDIDVLDIPPGQIVCFVGPSGCGKTTALRTIAGLVRHDEGDVFFGDRIVNDLAPEHRNAAMVFQNYALFPHMTVNENVAFGLTVRFDSSDADRDWKTPGPGDCRPPAHRSFQKRKDSWEYALR